MPAKPTNPDEMLREPKKLIDDKITREGITRAREGRVLDALIAERVIGWKMIGDYHPGISLDLIGVNHLGIPDVVPHYSTDITAALDVANKIHDEIAIGRFEAALFNYLTLSYTGNYWAAAFESIDSVEEWYEEESECKLVSRADTAALAICRAALLAIMELE